MAALHVHISRWQSSPQSVLPRLWPASKPIIGLTSGSGGPSHWAKLDAKYAACAAKSQSPIEIQTHDVRAADASRARVRLPAGAASHCGQWAHHPGELRSRKLADGRRQALRTGPVPFSPAERRSRRREAVRDGCASRSSRRSRPSRGRCSAAQAGPGECPRRDSLAEFAKGEREGSGQNRVSRSTQPHCYLRTLGYYAYSGSLTTPPCSEGVRWLVLKTPSLVSIRELEIFAARYPNNARPIQPRNGRQVLSSE